MGTKAGAQGEPDARATSEWPETPRAVPTLWRLTLALTPAAQRADSAASDGRAERARSLALEEAGRGPWTQAFPSGGVFLPTRQRPGLWATPVGGNGFLTFCLHCGSRCALPRACLFNLSTLLEKFNWEF